MQVAAGKYHTLALAHSNHVYAWGEGAHGALGVNDTRTRRVPNQVTTPASPPNPACYSLCVCVRVG